MDHHDNWLQHITTTESSLPWQVQSGSDLSCRRHAMNTGTSHADMGTQRRDTLNLAPCVMLCHWYGWDLFKCDLETESKTKSKTPTLHQHIHQLRKSLSWTQIIAKFHEHHSQASGFSRSEVGCELKRRLRDLGRSWIKPWSRRKMTQALPIAIYWEIYLIGNIGGLVPYVVYFPIKGTNILLYPNILVQNCSSFLCRVAQLPL